MSQFNKQFAIIDKIKSLVKKTARPFQRSNGEPPISEEIARKIQKNSYDLSHSKIKETFTPAYKIITEQLQVDDDQIFRGAVFNLMNIALTTEEYANDIVHVLEKAMNKELRTQEQLEYLKSKISVIKENQRIKK